MLRSRWTAVLAAAALAGGCVPRSQYLEMKSKYQEEHDARLRLEEELKRGGQPGSGSAEAEIHNLREELKAKDRVIAMLRERGTAGGIIDIPAGPGMEKIKGGGVRLPSDVNFRPGSAQLTDKGKQALDAIAEHLKKQPGPFLLVAEGHTDTDPIRVSGHASNWELSGKRAAAVINYLVKDKGVCSGENAMIRGFGEFRPNEEDPSNKAKNRRVELYAYQLEKGAAAGRR